MYCVAYSVASGGIVKELNQLILDYTFSVIYFTRSGWNVLQFPLQFDVKEQKVVESHPQWDDMSDDEEHDDESGSDEGSTSDDNSEFEYDEDN